MNFQRRVTGMMYVRQCICREVWYVMMSRTGLDYESNLTWCLALEVWYGSDIANVSRQGTL